MTAGPAAPVTVVVGAGLVGASIGHALTAAGWPVHLVDAVPSHAAVAAGLGAGTAEPADPDQVGLVVVAVPPRVIADVVGESLDTYPHATVTDVGSVKAGVLDALWERPVDLTRYVGSHPMAGSHHSGPVTADGELFVDRTWVVTPHRKSAESSVERVVELVRACRARLVTLDVDDHDAAVARVSHLPHLVSVLMAGHLTNVPEEDLVLAGQGLRDVTRIAGSDPGLWQQIVGANSTAVLRELRQVAVSLDRLISAVETGPADPALVRELERGVDGTRRIPGKHGAAPVPYEQVVVAIPDEPGALARLFGDVEAAGVNVEDIAIEHDASRQVGYLTLSVQPERAEGLALVMRDGGWTVV
ncbi:prephenate dehydrogenase [Microlunatus sagamiharensis]|uniref:Prephenate dehydrogenase n=1 Tax=Microlunatus sagamiharensis TaxID=546874 RepID=A0A1H2M5X0_9ACTN|nr:prephenate dehydrogenase [Microlunatus sagamiharensis]SDU88514.1 prephenate dehydrogenase [Microlunatus sagamiharensis]